MLTLLSRTKVQSAKALQKRLKEMGIATNVISTRLRGEPKNLTRFRQRLLADSSHVIRWGTSDHSNLSLRNCLNKPEAIQNSSAKLEALKIMKDAGVRVVPFSTNGEELLADCGRIVGRNAYHRGGTDVRLYTCSPVPSRNHYTKFLAPAKEYRYHVVAGKVIAATVKMKGDVYDDPDDITRNHQDGSGWAQIECNSIASFLQTQALKVIEALKLDFGAVDMLFYDKHTYVLEVNTAPTLTTESRVNAYADAFAEIAEEN